ncbi:MAG TPA: hypothetical protein VKB18_02420 [Gemmatimonadota bacterium]|nr:hypothetical protein [Gemmatimonadota bacterium]
MRRAAAPDRPHTSTPILATLALVTVSVVTAAAPTGLTAQQRPDRAEPTLEAVRAAAERYGDVRAALAAGYVEDPSGMCVEAGMVGRPAEEGAMGIHYLRPDLLGLLPVQEGRRVDGTGTHTDFLTPAILMYEPREDGTLELVGVENLVFQKAWKAAGHDAPPTFMGRSWNAMTDDPATPVDEGHGFEPHFDLHVWVFRANPRGTLESFNPAVICAHARMRVMSGS